MGLEGLLGKVGVTPPAYVGLVVLGVLHCFLGYRLFRVLLGVWGFVVGFVLLWAELQSAALAPLPRMGVAALGGVLGVVLVSVVYAVGVFLFGAGCGVLLALALVHALPALPLVPPALVLGALGGVAALVLQRPLIMLLTALSGAWILVACAAALIFACPPGAFPRGCPGAAPWTPAILAAWLLLGFLGCAAQARLTRGRPRRSDDRD